MRILLLRPLADAQRSARAVAARGNEPVVAPLFEIVPSAETAPAGPFSAVVLTSGNAVPALSGAPAEWRDLPVFTVGARTATKARDAGFGDARSADGDRNDLIDLIGRNLPPPAKLLLIVGKDRHEDVPQRLREAGYEVVLWEAYAAQAVAILPKEAAIALSAGGADAVLHYSRRGAETFVALTRAVHLTDEALALTHVALSADVAAPLIAAGADTVLVAEFPEEAGMLAALDEISARNRIATPLPPTGEIADAPAAEISVAVDGDAASESPAQGKRRAAGQRGSHRTPPTIDGQIETATTEPAQATTATESASETVLPTEALPQEFAAPEAPPPIMSSSAAPDTSPSEPAMAAIAAQETKPRLHWPALALAGIVGGVIGAGLVMLALSRATPAVSSTEIAELRSRIDGLQGAATALDGKTTAAAAAAAKASADAQAAGARATELASAQRAQAPDSAALAGLSTQVQRAEAAATAIGQRLDQTTARIGSVETLAKTAASPSAQSLAAARIVLSERIQSAIASGQPFAGDVAALSKGGAAPEQLAALNAVAATGAPTRDALLAQFRGQRAMFARELTPATASWQDKVLGLASRIVTIRPVGDTGANDPATLLIRFENAISTGSIGAAAGLWGQLPEPARRTSADFGTSLQKRAAADAAIAKIAQDAVAALGAAG